MNTKHYKCETCDQTEESTTETPSECSWCLTPMTLVSSETTNGTIGGMSVAEAKIYLASKTPDEFFGLPEGTIAKKQGSGPLR
jgi:hypothetical protein